MGYTSKDSFLSHLTGVSNKKRIIFIIANCKNCILY